MQIDLVPMSEEEVEAYLARIVPEYAREGGRATGMPMDEALEKARSMIEGLLTQGGKTPGHHLRKVAAPEGDAVGVVWFAEQLEESPPLVFLYDVAIDEAHRGRGLGSAALLALEEEARGLGAEAIRLSVFDHNEGAIRLYERLGYTTTRRGEGGIQMTRTLSD
jgi:ribosomal protein S18 acetylase RimI-like enzyme